MNTPATDAPSRRRTHAAVPRRRQVLVRLSDAEFDAVRVHAGAVGLAVGAWLGELAVRSADRTEWALAMSRREVVRQLVRVRLDVALVDQVLREVDHADVRSLVAAALRRLDELVDRVVDDPNP